MNIFASDICPVKSARFLDDKRLVKMVLETAQLLSTAIFLNTEEKNDELYRPTHKKHPCAIWAGYSRENYAWLKEHFIALYSEYNHRYNRVHKSSVLIKLFVKYEFLITEKTFTTFANCTRDLSLNLDFTHMTDVVLAYQKYLTGKWTVGKTVPKWTNNVCPDWFK